MKNEKKKEKEKKKDNNKVESSKTQVQAKVFIGILECRSGHSKC